MNRLLQRHLVYWFCVLLLSIGFSWHLFAQVKPYAEYVDTLDNLKIAYNLAKYNAFSASNINGESTTSESDTLAFFVPGSEKVVSPSQAMPTAVREPLPIWIDSLLIRKLHLLARVANVEQLNAGNPLMLLKLQNFFYLCAMFLALALLLRAWQAPAWWQLLCTVMLFFLVSQHLAGHLYALLSTELLASALMLWCCVFLWCGMRHHSYLGWLIGGVCLGLLMLTKAAFLYVGAGLILLTAGYLWRHDASARGWRGLLLMTVVSLLVVAPWVLRNLQTLHFFGISERAADVLLVRAEKNLMSPLERRGAICIYTNNMTLKRFCAHYFGLFEKDLLPEGRLARLVRGHPQDLQARKQMDASRTISFYYHATTQAYKARYEAYQQQRSVLEANRQTQRMAIQLILQHPQEHLLATFLFAYRGLNVQYADIYTFAGFFALLLMAVAGMQRRDPAAFAIAVLPGLMFAFYALCSHFIPRYADPLIPFWMLGLVINVMHGVHIVSGKMAVKRHGSRQAKQT